VIEGYPRSANTFAIVALQQAESHPVKIAHHLHAPAQIIWATRKCIPSLVLIRKPVDAVISLCIRQPYVSFRQALRNYIRFYTRIFPYRDKYVVTTFDEVISNYDEIIRKVNARFGTFFAIFEPTEENMRKCYEFIDKMDLRDTKFEKVTATTVARPSQEREKMKDLFKKELKENSLRDLIIQAEAIYYKMVQKTG